MRATLIRTSNNIVAVAKSDGRLTTSTTAVTLKNQVSEIRSIEDIADVSEIDVSSGSTIVYNSENDKYEVRKLQSSDLGAFNLDGGSF